MIFEGIKWLIDRDIRGRLEDGDRDRETETDKETDREKQRERGRQRGTDRNRGIARWGTERGRKIGLNDNLIYI